MTTPRVSRPRQVLVNIVGQGKKNVTTTSRTLSELLQELRVDTGRFPLIEVNGDAVPEGNNEFILPVEDFSLNAIPVAAGAFREGKV
jgi:uncharacterized protein YabE (DUF348 family)